MKVTKISQQVKRPDRYSIYIDEKYYFSLNEYQLAGSGLRVGKELTEDELQEFANESQFGKAYERTLNYVMIRPRSEKEIKDYLTRTYMYPKPKSYVNKKTGERVFLKQEVDKASVQQIIDRVTQRLTDKGYIDDEKFTKSWVQSRMMHKKPSKRKLEQELYAKGIDQTIIATVLQNEELNEKSNMLKLVNKKRKLVRYQDDQRLIAYLLRQGFNYEDIKDTLRDE
jgi:regulatory protein